MTTQIYITKNPAYKAVLWKTKTPFFLAKLDVELTERCNNNCIHCCINLPADDVKAKRKRTFYPGNKKYLK